MGKWGVIVTAQLFPPPKFFWGLRLSPSPHPSRTLLPPPNERGPRRPCSAHFNASVPTIGCPSAPPPLRRGRDLQLATEEGGGTGGAAGGGALDSALVEKKEVRRGGRLLLLRKVLKRLGYC